MTFSNIETEVHLTAAFIYCATGKFGPESPQSQLDMRKNLKEVRNKSGGFRERGIER